jgi:hypothetical protein
MWQMSPIAKIGIIIGIAGGGLGLLVATIAAPPFGILMTLIFVGVFGWVFISLIKPQLDGQKLMQTGKDGSAEVMKIWDTGWTMNNDPQIGMTLMVTPADGSEPYETDLKQFISRLDVPNFQVGQKLAVKIDPNNPKKIGIAGLGGSASTESPKPNEKVLMKAVKASDEFNKRLGKSGKPAKAIVKKVTFLGAYVNGENPFNQFDLEVIPDGKPAFTTIAKGVISVASVDKYKPGAEIFVKYDPKDKKQVALDHS